MMPPRSLTHSLTPPHPSLGRHTSRWEQRRGQRLWGEPRTLEVNDAGVLTPKPPPPAATPAVLGASAALRPQPLWRRYTSCSGSVVGELVRQQFGAAGAHAGGGWVVSGDAPSHHTAATVAAAEGEDGWEGAELFGGSARARPGTSSLCPVVESAAPLSRCRSGAALAFLITRDSSLGSSERSSLSGAKVCPLPPIEGPPSSSRSRSRSRSVRLSWAGCGQPGTATATATHDATAVPGPVMMGGRAAQQLHSRRCTMPGSSSAQQMGAMERTSSGGMSYSPRAPVGPGVPAAAASPNLGQARVYRSVSVSGAGLPQLQGAGSQQHFGGLLEG